MCKKINTKTLIHIALCVVIICLCSLISIPATIPFTLQTFSIFFTLLFLGGVNGTIAIFVYILLGIIGLPIFSSFGSGISVIAGPTGGYIVGFLIIGLMLIICDIINKFFFILKIIFLFIGLILCYLLGTFWFVVSMNQQLTISSILSASIICVVPFIIPDIIKLAVAIILSKQLKRILNKSNVI